MSDFVRDMAERLYRRPKSHLLNERTPTKTRCGLVAAQCEGEGYGMRIVLRAAVFDKPKWVTCRRCLRP